MTAEERAIALYCLKANSDYHSEVCEECINYPKCDHTMQADVTETIIKALEQEPCDDAISRADVKKYLSAPNANGDRVIYEDDLDLKRGRRMRGCLTKEIKEKYDITLKQLRLLPYFQYLLMNESSIDAMKIDSVERVILQQWRDEGRITFSISEPCTCTKEFWDWMNEILWESYVPHKESRDEE